MSEYPKEEVLGFNVGDFDKLVCMRCVREGRDEPGVTRLREDIILFKKDMDENKIYFCDCCHSEIRTDIEIPEIRFKHPADA